MAWLANYIIVLVWSERRHLGGSVAGWKPALRASLGHYLNMQIPVYVYQNATLGTLIFTL
jgi:hypothetical protein